MFGCTWCLWSLFDKKFESKSLSFCFVAQELFQNVRCLMYPPMRFGRCSACFVLVSITLFSYRLSSERSKSSTVWAPPTVPWFVADRSSRGLLPYSGVLCYRRYGTRSEKIENLRRTGRAFFKGSEVVASPSWYGTAVVSGCQSKLESEFILPYV